MRSYYKCLTIIFIAVLMGCKGSAPADDKAPKISSDNDSKKVKISDNYKYITSVRKNDTWRFINENNELLFDKQFTYASYFSDGLACVSMDGFRLPGGNAAYGSSYTAMDKKGNFNENIKSDQPFVFKEGRAIISEGNYKMLIDKEGNVLKKSILKANGNYNEGKVHVFKDGKIEYWDKNGDIVIGPSAFTTAGFSENRAMVLLNGKYGFINELGEQVIDYKYDNGKNYSEDFAAVKKNDEYYFINKQGAEKLGPYQEVRSFSEGKAAVKTDDGWHFIDKNGEQLFGQSFLEADDFSEEVAMVRLKNGKMAMVNTIGKITELDARVAFQFKNGIAIAEKNGKMGFITKEGKWLIDAEYDRVNDFVER